MSDQSNWAALAAADPAAANRVLAELRGVLWTPHGGGQQDVLDSDARFRILRAGRRWGKTELAAHEAVMAAVRKPNQMIWWVSNSDKNVRRGYRKVTQQLPRSLLAKPAPSPSSHDRILTLRNGSMIEFYTAGSASKGDSSDASALTGEGVDFLVVDEAALIHEMVWYQHLRPTLSDTGGRALIFSTPRGRNWFWKLWQRGQRPGGLYDSFHFTSFDNPTIDPAEFEDARDTLPTILFQQEYLADFVSNAASIFAVPESQVLPHLEAALGQIVMGVDLAKRQDWTVLDAARADDRVPVLHERWQKLPWPDTQRDIVSITRELEALPDVEGVTLVVDSTGVGEVVYDALDEEGLDVIPINFSSAATTTSRWKEEAVKLLAADLEHKRAFILEEQREEFESYEYEITPGGRYKFEARSGHDDEVSAKLLQNWGIVHEGVPAVRTLKVGEDEPDDDLEEGEEQEIVPDSAEDIMDRAEAWA